MRRNVVVSGVLIAVFALVVVVVAFATRTSPGGSDEEAASTSSAVSVVREDSHVLSDAGEGAPVLVEFLDFECESCRAASRLWSSCARSSPGS